jgi:hypothetical protein
MARPKDQRPARLHAIGELLPQDKEEDGYARGHLFCLSFIFPVFLPFTANVTRALPLESIKGEAGPHLRGQEETIKQQQLEPISIETTHHHHSQET